MRAISTILILLFAALSTCAQDMLIFKDGREMSAKITEVSATEVKYKKADNPDGPTYATPKAELFMVKYKNGSKETFSNAAATRTEAEPNNAYPAAGLSDQTQKALELKEFMAAKAKKEYDDKYAEYSKLKNSTKSSGVICSAIGGFIMLAGAGVMTYGIVYTDNNLRDWDSPAYSTADMMSIVGGSSIGVGFPVFLAGVAQLGRMNKYKRKLNELEKPTASISPSIIRFQGHGQQGIGSANAAGFSLQFRF